MKRVFIVIFLIINSLASAKTYYVSTTGKDSNPGTFSQPWLSWNYAFNNTPPSDTCYFRGGVYPAYSTSVGVSLNSSAHDGTYTHPTCFFNYPGEVPVLDCVAMTSAGNYGIALRNCHNLYIKGLTVECVRQIGATGVALGWFINNGYAPHLYAPNNLRFENCVAHNIGGQGFVLQGSDSTYFINCDAYNLADSLTAYDPAGWGTGFEMDDGDYLDAATNTYFYLKGCRGWNCGDQGFAYNSAGPVVMDSCWSINNGSSGLGQSKGSGLKIWIANTKWKNTSKLQIIVHNCIFVDNYLRGINFCEGTYQTRVHIFNNLIYRNGHIHPNGSQWGSGFFDPTPADTVGRWDHWAWNNISLGNCGEVSPGVKPGDVLTNTVHQSNNLWDVASNPVTSADFVSLDTTGLTGPRQANGSLPVTTFGHLSSTSHAEDAGIYVGLPYSGSAPDIGWVEYSGTNSNQKPVTSITVTGTGGTTTISADKGTLQLTAAVLPSDAANKTVRWSVANGTGQATISSSGLLNAVSNGTVTVRATANDGSGVYGTLVITISNQVIPVTGMTVTGTGGATTITTNGGSLQLSAEVLPANATNKTVTWSITSGSNLASINVSTGLVTAIDNGTATVIATANDGSGVYGTITITISNQIIPVTNITVSGEGGSTLITIIGGTLQLNTTILPANATNKSVTWSIVSGTDNASISSTGLVTAIDNGTATVRVIANDGSGVYGTLLITISNQVIAVNGITVTGTGGATTITSDGGSLQLSAEVLPSNATNKNVTWSITNGSNIASINASTGLVTAIDNGTVTVRVTANDGSGVYGTVTITISNQIIPVTGITVTGAGGATTITTGGGSLQLNAAILPANASNKNVTWSITNGSSLASINATTGLVTAINNGTITAKATANDGSGIYGTLVIMISYIANLPPIVVANYRSSSYSGFVSEIDASGSYDPNKDNITFSWVVPSNIPVSSTTGSTIQYLIPVSDATQKVQFVLNVSDGKTTTSKTIPIEIYPYEPGLDVAEVANIAASSYSSPNYPSNIIDGDIGTMWASEGDGQWLLLELKTPFSVQYVDIAFRSGQTKESIFDIMGSNDLITWETILTKSNSCAFSGALQVFDFPASKTNKEFKYIKVIGHGNSTDTWNYISEFRIFGYKHKNPTSYEEQPVKIYPNPANEFINIRIDEPTLLPDFIQFIDLSGKVIFRDKVDPDIRQFTIPVNFKKGIYIIQLGSDKLTLFTQKLIVTN